MKYDIFISHASEDKLQVALPLAHYLNRHGVKVWIDEFELTIGDSLRSAIDLGLSESRFGAVILSPDFFRKGWTNRELDGLVAREDGRDKVVLPIWHKVTKEDVISFSPMLAGKLGVSTQMGIEHVGNMIIKAIQTQAEYSAVDSAPTQDSLTRELAILRRDMIATRSPWELRELLFKTEDFLARYPHHPEGRLLQRQIEQALMAEVRDETAEKLAYRRQSSPLWMILAILILSGIGYLLVKLIQWLWAFLK